MVARLGSYVKHYAENVLTQDKALIEKSKLLTFGNHKLESCKGLLPMQNANKIFQDK